MIFLQRRKNEYLGCALRTRRTGTEFKDRIVSLSSGTL